MDYPEVEPELEICGQNSDGDSEKHERIFIISDTVYKILCMADNKNYEPAQGLENLAMMYLSLAGPIDFDQLELERARAKARQLKLTLSNRP